MAGSPITIFTIMGTWCQVMKRPLVFRLILRNVAPFSNTAQAICFGILNILVEVAIGSDAIKHEGLSFDWRCFLYGYDREEKHFNSQESAINEKKISEEPFSSD